MKDLKMKNQDPWNPESLTMTDEELNARSERVQALIAAQSTPFMADGTPRPEYYDEASEGLIDAEVAEYLAAVDLNSNGDEEQEPEEEIYSVDIESWVLGGVQEYKEAIYEATGNNFSEIAVSDNRWVYVDSFIFSTINHFLPEGMRLHPLGYIIVNPYCSYTLNNSDCEALATSAIWKAINLTDLFKDIVSILTVEEA